jgi:hypothetical protein
MKIFYFLKNFEIEQFIAFLGGKLPFIFKFSYPKIK